MRKRMLAALLCACLLVPALTAPAVFFMPLMMPLAYTCATAPRYASGIYAQSGILRAAPFVTASVSPRTLARKFRIITAIS